MIRKVKSPKHRTEDIEFYNNRVEMKIMPKKIESSIIFSEFSRMCCSHFKFSIKVTHKSDVLRR